VVRAVDHPTVVPSAGSILATRAASSFILRKKGLETVELAVEKLANESSLAPAMARFSEEERAAGNDFCLRTLALMEEMVFPGLEAAEEDGASRAASKPSGRRPTRSR